MTRRHVATAVITIANALFIAWWCQITALRAGELIACYFISYCLAVTGLVAYPKNVQSGIWMHTLIFANVTVIISPVLLIFWGMCIAAFLGI